MKKSLLQECLRQAVRSNTPEHHNRYGSYHHFSFVIQHNSIVGWATNSAGKNIYSHFYYETSMIHSEAAVFKKVKGKMDRDIEFDIVNIRLNKQHEMRISKPCECCMSFLSTFNCRKIWYTTDAGFESCRINDDR